ncbi:bifunctional phosphoribosylaminoimidazolecarboxamide formyltransferase/IMP cyclohydrolase [Phormidium tenue]|uniref:Bifunctional purine biosynthesis protein PurH n=1 Tax=Phormidium tenue NIES-30 TaxID=549789 RepID=A0A1U7J9Q0_9CYAN|nr:bifunctional phosphoribosylaminoimidazolecarboxamide formyltransferase/IMP cyclohydrolase [Phormidium tenue]MBD2231102.1 bifunctional phosphoribosylaminoimidazolecarboxamide formyltransferase/IMP cyclohydrolase [Phormidium tenue FACHB-1052]OKH50233.1 bifunctional phosphoribosylaminoimidazolecarboxamide formyltransferase/IMP cyclohydrolase [Phormidium tenue NIES-30]
MARLALLSVSDKTGLVELAKTLVEEFGFDLISSGGTAKAIAAAGLPVTKVSDYTGSPEILGGRVKTLHPKIHGGILARQDLAEDQKDLADNGIRPLDLVVVNLYPFEQTIAKDGVTMADAIENIDIGGPAMLRAAAKNHTHLTVLCSAEQYEPYLDALRASEGQVPLAFRQACARAAFWHTASYDQAIATYLTAATSEEGALPQQWAMTGRQQATLRYGENPHQTAAWYRTGSVPTGWAGAEQLQGKELSYNNLVDLEAARRIIAEFPSDRPAAAVLKHTNPCGVGMGDTLASAYRRAYDADDVSAFGGIVVLNRPIDADTAEQLTGTFLECIVAPGCDRAAQDILAKKQNLRVLVLEDLLTGPQQVVNAIAGGFLLQAPDTYRDDPATWQIVTEAKPTEAELAEMLFAWRVVKHVKSNAIVVTHQQQTLGIGAGQMNRVGSVSIALAQAGAKAQGAVLASDGFFPFDDSVRTAAAAGIRAVVQPGGSRRDEDSIKAANELGLVMAMTGVRHFLH